MENVSLRAKVGVIMGSKSDLETMSHAIAILREFAVPFETEIVSAHRTPDKLYRYARTARERGLRVIVAGAGGAAHLPGMTAALTTVPVIGVPVETRMLRGLDSLLSIVQMPAGIPVATVAIGVAGAKNAALLAVSILAGTDELLAQKLEKFRERQTQTVLDTELFDSEEEETEQ
ncbi:MAG: 5-(carboxyamino)imidazole ribonucleotide mutase [Bacilli bacterium]